MSHSFTNLLYHVVFGTKGREPWLEAAMRPDLFAVLGGLVQEQGGIPLAVGGVEDHVHLFAKLRQDVALSDVPRAVKAKSARWVHKTQPRCPAFAWQTGYGAFSVSQSRADTVRRYIANQEEHHKRQPFADEFRALLRAHHIDFSEEDLWD